MSKNLDRLRPGIFSFEYREILGFFLFVLIIFRTFLNAKDFCIRRRYDIRNFFKDLIAT